MRRNYCLAFLGCLATTVLSLMGKGNWENLHWFILSDINVAIWLTVAWLFDERRSSS